MAVPFRRTSYKQKKQRQTPSKLKFLKKSLASINNLTRCNNCNEVKKSHWICQNCSFYDEEKR